jgi:hypothetical protein
MLACPRLQFFGLALMLGAWAIPAHADLLEFSFTSNSGTVTAIWEQPSNPTPSLVDGVSDIVISVSDGTETVGGVTDPVASVTFFTSDDGGGFETSSFEVNTFGPQLFTGDISSPTFSPMFSAGTSI